MDLIESLNREFKTDDILSTFKTQSKFMSAFILLGDGVRKFAPLVGLSKDASNNDIFNKIRDEIRPFYKN